MVVEYWSACLKLWITFAVLITLLWMIIIQHFEIVSICSKPRLVRLGESHTSKCRAHRETTLETGKLHTVIKFNKNFTILQSMLVFFFWVTSDKYFCGLKNFHFEMQVQDHPQHTGMNVRSFHKIYPIKVARTIFTLKYDLHALG